MKVHEVFPTLVVQDRIDVHEEFKEQYFEELKSLWFDGYNNETPEHLPEFSGVSLLYPSNHKDFNSSKYCSLNSSWISILSWTTSVGKTS